MHTDTSGEHGPGQPLVRTQSTSSLDEPTMVVLAKLPNSMSYPW